jgi:hypothetical protein
MTYRGYADDIWMQLVPLLPQFCIAMITKFQEQLEEQFDRKTVQENDRKLMVSICIPFVLFFVLVCFIIVLLFFMLRIIFIIR